LFGGAGRRGGGGGTDLFHQVGVHVRGRGGGAGWQKDAGDGGSGHSAGVPVVLGREVGGSRRHARVTAVAGHGSTGLSVQGGSAFGHDPAGLLVDHLCGWEVPEQASTGLLAHGWRWQIVFAAGKISMRWAS